MMRHLSCLLLLAVASPAAADTPDYRPMNNWIGMGYKDKVLKDGTIRVTAGARGDRAIDIAMYRAAEIARAQGYAYVQMLGGFQSGNRFQVTATLDIRPSDSPAPPATCPSKKRGACYTADVKEVLRILGGPGGTQPGEAITDHVDNYGRSVSYSGYGIGAVTARPRFVPVPARLSPSPAIVTVASRASAYATVVIPPSPGTLPQSFAQRMARPVAIAATAPVAKPARAARRHVVNEGVVVSD